MALTKQLLLAVALLLPLHLIAQEQAVQVYKYKSKQGVTSFSDIAPIDHDYQQIRIGCYACQLNSQVNWQKTKLYLQQYQTEIIKTANQYNIDPALIQAVIHAESHFDRFAISKQGAQGLMQLMPKTAKSLGITNPFNAQQNIQAGSQHLARLLQKYRGNITLASAAYNAGESTIKKYQGVPPYPETQAYVERVRILHARYQQKI
ncbi:lytic transglycosylase domain-containing protein [Thalassotalea sp. PLHSN55]|uniref:lytic transglycosylase domain-containing protein n=1 Tax=Thalassotalea sp. PLHSN55 TaxID=3435888 RepID=UPI003F828104